MATLTKPDQRDAREDREIEQRVLHFLSGMQRTPLRSIEVEVNNGRVTLTGTLHSFYEKQLCLRCFQHVEGVTRINDRITVHYLGSDSAG
jgi:osmotically-inducible protein OsmY